MRPSSVLVSAGMRAAAPEEAVRLRVSAGSDVAVVDRVRLAESVPMASERAVLAPGCARVLVVDLTASSLHAAMVSLGIVPHHGQSSVAAQAAGAVDRRLLNVSARTALLIERRLIADEYSVPVEWTESRYVPDRYALTIVAPICRRPRNCRLTGDTFVE